MKKLRILALMLCVSLTIPFFSVSANLGDVEGYTKYTDIVAYINHFAIESFNVNGKTCVVAEDLANYGFRVYWSDSARSLYITRNRDVDYIDQYSVPYETDPSMVGKDALPILSTDIRTFVDGEEADSYNIDGKTVVDFESLSAFGPVNWDGGLRVIKLWVEDGLEMNYCMQSLRQIPKTTLYSEDGRTISVYPSEVEAYLNVGWYKTKDEAQAVANRAKNQQSLSKFYVGQNVYLNLLVMCKYGTIRDIDYDSGKVSVYWYLIEDSSGYEISGLSATMFYGLYSTTWENASSLTPLY